MLLPRSAKQNPDVLGKVAFCVLAGRWLDLYQIILPAFPQLTPNVLVESGLAVGAAGVALLTLLRALQQAPLIPRHDPYLMESLPSSCAAHHAQQCLPGALTADDGPAARRLLNKTV